MYALLASSFFFHCLRPENKAACSRSPDEETDLGLPPLLRRRVITTAQRTKSPNLLVSLNVTEVKAI